MEYAFAALKKNHTVVTWGNKGCGCDSNELTDKLINVDEMYSTRRAFAALKKDGSVVTWGENDWGGDSSSVADQLELY